MSPKRDIIYINRIHKVKYKTYLLSKLDNPRDVRLWPKVTKIG